MLGTRVCYLQFLWHKAKQVLTEEPRSDVRMGTLETAAVTFPAAVTLSPCRPLCICRAALFAYLPFTFFYLYYF